MYYIYIYIYIYTYIHMYTFCVNVWGGNFYRVHNNQKAVPRSSGCILLSRYLRKNGKGANQHNVLKTEPNVDVLSCIHQWRCIYCTLRRAWWWIDELRARGRIKTEMLHAFSKYIMKGLRSFHWFHWFRCNIK